MTLYEDLKWRGLIQDISDEVLKTIKHLDLGMIQRPQEVLLFANAIQTPKHYVHCYLANETFGKHPYSAFITVEDVFERVTEHLLSAFQHPDG